MQTGNRTFTVILYRAMHSMSVMESSLGVRRNSLLSPSRTEAEYVALTHGSKDMLWIQKLLSELHPFVDFRPPIDLYCNNQGAICLSKDLTFHGHTKHIDVHFHFIRQMISMGAISLKYCPTEDMIADIFTKSLAHVKFEKFRNLFGLV